MPRRVRAPVLRWRDEDTDGTLWDTLCCWSGVKAMERRGTFAAARWAARIGALVSFVLGLLGWGLCQAAGTAWGPLGDRLLVGNLSLFLALTVAVYLVTCLNQRRVHKWPFAALPTKKLESQVAERGGQPIRYWLRTAGLAILFVALLAMALVGFLGLWSAVFGQATRNG